MMEVLIAVTVLCVIVAVGMLIAQDRAPKYDPEDGAIPASTWLSVRDTSGDRKPYLYCGDGVWKRLLTEDDLPALTEGE
jgi:hypothetical protein